MPTAAMVPNQMPNRTRPKLNTNSIQLASVSRLGVSTNRNGRNVLQPTTHAIQPVVQPWVRAILAAA